MILVVLLIGLAILFVAVKYLMVSEAFLSGLVVAIIVNSYTSNWHMLFRIIVFIAIWGIIGGLVFTIFENKVGFWILSVVLSIFWAWIFGAICWGSYGDIVWTVFLVLVCLGGSMGLHIYGAHKHGIDIN